MTSADSSIATTSQLDAEEIEQVLALVEQAEAADGVSPLSEHARLHLRRGGGLEVLSRTPQGELAGYAHLDDADAELVVAPDHRQQGQGTALVQELERVVRAHGPRIWAHGNLPAAVAAAEALGYLNVRELWQMRRSLTEELPEPKPLEGLRLRAFRPGQDEQAWLRVNARAFAHHPEQGSWTMTDLAEREASDWFDPEGLLIAEDTRDGAGTVAGFHWTKEHPGSSGEGAEPFGEVYVLAVDPAYQGRGLGPALTIAGLEHLRARGLATVMLYVDGDNAAAVATYQRLGFARVALDVMYARSPTEH